MENATKALIMAGGVLIAVIIIALLYSFMATLSENAQNEDLQLLAKQTEKFNKEYEAFEQKLLRGTELITLINKAIANNEKYEDQDKIYDVDVVFTLQTDITEVRIDVKDGKAGEPREYGVFAAAKKYSLIDEKSYDRINEELRDFMKIGAHESEESYHIVPLEGEKTKDQDNYTKVYDSFTVFKRKFFTCTNIEYSSKTGRVNLLEFEERVLGKGQLQGYN